MGLSATLPPILSLLLVTSKVMLQYVSPLLYHAVAPTLNIAM